MSRINPDHVARLKTLLASLAKLSVELADNLDNPALTPDQFVYDWDYVAHDVNEVEKVLEDYR